MPTNRFGFLVVLTLLGTWTSRGISEEERPHFRELRHFDATEAHQGVAVDEHHFYAVTNRAIGKYKKDSGELVAEWKAPAGSSLRHLNGGTVIRGKLYCAHSTWPRQPLQNSIEIWDAETLQHIGRREFPQTEGALTWVDQQADHWWIVFAYYGDVDSVQRTTLIELDDEWEQKASWRFPPEVVQRFVPYSNSGGSWGPNGLLYTTGHDRGELYALRVSAAGKPIELVDVVPAEIEGQGIAWDRSSPGTLYGIRRKTKQVVVSRLSPTKHRVAPPSKGSQ